MQNIKLSFGTVIALFIPGFFLLWVIMVRYDLYTTEEFKYFVEKGSVIAISSGAILSLIAGLLIDSIRFNLTWLPMVIPKFRNWVKIDMSKATGDSVRWRIRVRNVQRW